MIETDTPTFILPRQWGGRGLMDFLGIVKFFTPYFVFPVKWVRWLKSLETDTPTYILPRQWGGWALRKFLICTLLIYPPHLCPPP